MSRSHATHNKLFGLFGPYNELKLLVSHISLDRDVCLWVTLCKINTS